MRVSEAYRLDAITVESYEVIQKRGEVATGPLGKAQLTSPSGLTIDVRVYHPETLLPLIGRTFTLDLQLVEYGEGDSQGQRWSFEKGPKGVL